MKEAEEEKEKSRRLAGIQKRIHTIMVNERISVVDGMLIISEEMRMTVLPWLKECPEAETAILEILFATYANAVEAVMETARKTATTDGKKPS